jgi:hypothetical protein
VPTPEPTALAVISAAAIVVAVRHAAMVVLAGVDADEKLGL